LDWYQVSTINNGSAVALDSGLFANPVAPSVAGFGTAAYEDITTSSTDTTVGRVTKVGDFGLGGEVIPCPNIDLNDVVVTGFYDISGATLNKPPTLSPTNAVCMTIVRTSDNMVQMVYNRRSHQIFQRYKNTTWSSWTEVLTESNFGKTEIDALNIDADTLDSLNSTQFIRSDIDDTTAGKLGVGGYISPTSGAILQVNGFQRTGTIYLHPGAAPITGSVGVVLQNVSGALVWSNNTVNHSGNTNSYEFITNNIGERLLEGVAISTTEVDFPLPTPSFTYPASITALGGYEIKDARNSTVVATGVLPALSPIATPNFTRVRFTVVGAVVGKRYLGIATSINSKITVNF
jgi:hypothetical protein